MIKREPCLVRQDIFYSAQQAQSPVDLLADPLDMVVPSHHGTVDGHTQMLKVGDAV